jgi:uncharacterized protein YprB with RNaseH-like and TPR domain
MLKKTFCHTQGISNETEKVLWENGIGTWEEFLENFESISCIPQSKLEKIKTEIIFSREHLENNNLKYFQEKLIPKEHHRLANYGKIAYVDIETTGLSKYTDEITMIGIFDGETAKSYVSGQDLEEAYEKLKELGLAGGLKKIEIALGITRDDEVQGVDGFEAVRLWRRYKKGDENALRKLLIYNKEDIVNLKFLLEYYLKEKEKTRTPLYNFA